MSLPAPSREVVRRDTFEYYLEHGIKTDDELDLFIQEFFGYVLPRENICPEHTSPFAFLADQFFERVSTVLGFANRGGGKTIQVAMLNVLDAIFKPGVEIASAGAIMQQADKGYEYLRKFLLGEPLFLGLVESSIKSETVLRNGSKISIIAGTFHGLNSPHPQKFRIDEIELMPWVVLQEGLQMSIEKEGYKAQDTLTSTRKFQKGTMQRLLDEAKEKDIKIHSWCLAGDTVVSTPGGDTRIRDLVGKEPYVYSYKKGELVLQKVRKVQRTRRLAEVVKVSYSWHAGARGGNRDGSVVCTPDHLILLRSGKYRRAGRLRPGDRLMPFWKGLFDNPSNFDRCHYVGFTGQSRVREHRFVWEQIHGAIPPRMVVHHIDGNDLNNDPENLSLTTRVRHSQRHTRRWWKKATVFKKQKRNARVSAANLGVTSPAKSEANRRTWNSYTPEQYAKRCKAIRIGKQQNHIVTSVVPYGYQDVYDLEVEGAHNFACRDIFVHNCIFDVLEQCRRQCKKDPIYGDCPAFEVFDVKSNSMKEMCGGVAHRCKGWYKIDDFVKKAIVLDLETWETQWRNLRPAGSVLVYGDHYRDEEPWVCDPFPIPTDWLRVSAIDFGSTFVYLKFAIDTHTDTWYQYYEYYVTLDRSLEEHARVISDECKGDFGPKDWCYADPSGKQAIIDLNLAFSRLKGPKASPANNDVYAGINRVKAMFARRSQNGVPGKPQLVIFKWCKNTRKELSSGYMHKVEKDGTVNKDVIVKKDDHACDAVRYAIYSYTTFRPVYRSRRAKNLY